MSPVSPRLAGISACTGAKRLATLTPMRSAFFGLLFQTHVGWQTLRRFLGNDVRQRVRKHVVKCNFILVVGWRANVLQV